MLVFEKILFYFLLISIIDTKKTIRKKTNTLRLVSTREKRNKFFLRSFFNHKQKKKKERDLNK